MQPLSVKATLDEAMAAARATPGDASVRMKLFRLFVATGQWPRAATQLDTASSLDTDLGFTVMVYKQALACERFRAEVFAGQRTPVITGEPAQWLALMIEALRADALAPGSGAALRAQALELAEPSAGRLNGAAFDWIADADDRLGPVLEAFIDGKYYWVPFDRIERIDIQAPDDVLDLAWLSCEIRFSGGGSKHALLPVRYPGTETCGDDDLVLSRKTVWSGDDADGYRGTGQRVWTTNDAETGLLDVRTVEIG